jgi:hypothetical protein
MLLTFLRYFTNNLETYFLYLKFLLLNFFMSYSFQFSFLFYIYNNVKFYLLKPYIFSYYEISLFNNQLLIKNYSLFSQNFFFKFTFICDDLSLLFMWLSYLLVCLCVYFL